jgi:hypothetical protein
MPLGLPLGGPSLKKGLGFKKASALFKASAQASVRPRAKRLKGVTLAASEMPRKGLGEDRSGCRRQLTLKGPLKAEAMFPKAIMFLNF